MSSAAPLEVHTLLCHRDVPMAVRCLGSLLRYTHDPIGLVVHDDGTLKAEDCGRLAELGPVRFVARPEADDQVFEALRRLPHCTRFRRQNVFGLKLFDVPLLATGDIAYCDSDILFLRPFRGLFAWLDPRTSLLLMRDAANMYACTPRHLVLAPRFRLPARCNAGLFFCRQPAYDVDFIEWFLGLDLPRYRAAPTLVEQTAWAALGWRGGCRVWDPSQVALVRRREQLTGELVAGHFADDYGRQLLQSVATREPGHSAPQVTVGTRPTRRLTGWCLAAERAKLRLDALRGRLRTNRGTPPPASQRAVPLPSPAPSAPTTDRDG